MENKEIDQIAIDFTNKLNAFCTEKRQDFLIREVVVEGETSSHIETYNVSYLCVGGKGTWKINAVTKKNFWGFRSKFPLLRIKRKGDNITFKGLFTSTFSTFPVSQLQQELDRYLSICEQQPRDVFVKS